MAVDVATLVPLPGLKTECGTARAGFGMAVCPALGLVVTSNHHDNTLSVSTLPHTDVSYGAGAGLAHVCTLGGASSRAPMQFKFNSGESGDYTYYLLWLADLHGPRHLPPPPAHRRCQW